MERENKGIISIRVQGEPVVNKLTVSSALPLAIDHPIYVHILPPTGTKHPLFASSLMVAVPLSLCILTVT